MKKIGVHFLLSLTAVSLLFANTPILAKKNASAEEQAGKIKGVHTNRGITSKAVAVPAQEIPNFYSMIDNPTLASRGIDLLTLSEIEDYCDAIVEATFLEAVKQEDEYNSAGKYLYSYTRSSIKVDKVYAGNIKEGDILTLLEPYYIENIEGNWVLTHHENYYPSEKDKQYLWFLIDMQRRDPDSRFGPYYSLVICERGRYPVISTNARSTTDVAKMTNQDLDLSPNGNTKIYKNIFNEVIDKYLKSRCL